MSIHRPLAGAVALCLIVVACGGSTPAASDGAASAAPPSAAAVASAGASAPASAGPSLAPTPTPTATASPTPTATPTPTPTPAPTPATLALAANVWWGGYVIDVSGATYDPIKHKLLITATFLNTGTDANDVSRLGKELNVVWDSTYLPGNVSSGTVPAGGTVKVEILVQPPATFTPETAVLTFGQPDEHQATVPLNGDPAVSDQPTTLAVTGKVKMGQFVTFTVTSGLLLPASCIGYSNRIHYGALKKGEMSVVLWGVAANTEPRNDGFIDQGYVDVPDGTTQASNPSVSMYMPAKGTLRGDGMCFDVPAPGSGTYKLTLHESRSKKNGAITFVIP